MSVRFFKVNIAVYGGVVILIFHLISLSGIIFEPLDQITAEIVNRNINKEGLIEFLEAGFWFVAFLIYFILFIKSLKKTKSKWITIWLLFFTIFCFASFGEELSWGQHIFKFESTEIMMEINRQKETNLHNLNLIKVFGLSPEFPFYPYLRNANSIIAPTFWLTCTILWLVLPIIKLRRKSSGKKMNTIPVHDNKGIIIFFGLNIIAYIIIDKIFYDVGELFELSLALVAIMSAIEIWFEKVPKSSQHV